MNVSNSIKFWIKKLTNLSLQDSNRSYKQTESFGSVPIFGREKLGALQYQFASMMEDASLLLLLPLAFSSSLENILNLKHVPEAISV